MGELEIVEVFWDGRSFFLGGGEVRVWKELKLGKGFWEEVEVVEIY